METRVLKNSAAAFENKSNQQGIEAEKQRLYAKIGQLEVHLYHTFKGESDEDLHIMRLLDERH